MSKRQLPDTSHDAYASVKHMITPHHQKILDSLKILGKGSAEQIAFHLKMDHSQINRRVSEMERLELIYKPGLKVATKTGRNAYVWQICGSDGNPIIKTERSLPGKGISDYSKKLIQPDLFK